ncbi:MAG: META domain-containing protein [Mameliella sp.]|nr:META domain-containing protein [Phaeodactylibacter sp.]
MRMLLMMLLSFSLLACGSDTEKEGTDTKTASQEAGNEVVNPKVAVESELVLPADYEPAFPQVELKKWYLTDYVYEGRSMKADKEDTPLISIGNGKLSGNSGCNKFSADIALQADGTLSLGEIASTKMLCQGKMTQETRIYDLLKAANSYSVNKIFLEISGDKGQLSFRAAYTPQPDTAE